MTHLNLLAMSKENFLFCPFLCMVRSQTYKHGTFTFYDLPEKQYFALFNDTWLQEHLVPCMTILYSVCKSPNQTTDHK